MGTGLGISGTMFFRFSLLNQVLGWWFGNSLILCGSVEKWVVALKGILLTSTNKVHPSMLEGIPWSLDNFFKPYMMWKWNLLLGSPNTLPRMQTKNVFFILETNTNLSWTCSNFCARQSNFDRNIWPPVLQSNWTAHALHWDALWKLSASWVWIWGKGWT